MMLLFFSYTLPSSFFCSQIVFLLLLLSPIFPFIRPAPGAARLDWAQRLHCPNSKAVQRRGAGGRHTLINWRRAASLCVCFVGQVQLSHFSLLGNMKPHKQRNYAASCSYTGRDKGSRQRHRGAERKWKQDRGEPKWQGVGVFESVWQGGVKEWKCEWMVYVLVVKVQGYCIALDLTVLMLFFSTHSIQKCLMHLNESLAKDSSVTPNIATPKLQVKIHGFNWITEINGSA